MRLNDLSEIKIYSLQPVDFSPEQLDEICDLICTGGEVTKVGLEKRIRQAKLIAVAEKDGKFVACSSIKVPDPMYRAKIIQRAGIIFKPQLELGWSFTLPEYRNQKLGTKLKEELFKNIPPTNVYTTVRLKNNPAIKGIEKFGFKAVGTPYQGMSGDLISIFLVR
jgi:hypothetical protein